jgi:hypothetical protein
MNFTQPCPRELLRISRLKQAAPNRLFGAELNKEGDAV